MTSYTLDRRQIKYRDVQKSKKDKVVAAAIAFFIGSFGIHRFYLGQIGLGIIYCILGIAAFPLMAVISVIDAIVLLAMDNDKFNLKYNKDLFSLENVPQQQTRTVRSNKKTVTPVQQQPVERYQREQQQREEAQLLQKAQRVELKRHKANGINHFKEYDFKAAIVDFEKALAIHPEDPSVHFNLACAHSLLEDTDKALYHLDKAVANGFNDFARIKTHDALAYVRIQDEFDAFRDNKFRLKQSKAIPVQEIPSPIEAPKGDLLEQLKQLGELRERGHLTDAEFIQQKQKLFR